MTRESIPSDAQVQGSPLPDSAASGNELELLRRRQRVLSDLAAEAVRCKTLNELADALANLFRGFVSTDAFLLDVYNPVTQSLTPVGYYDTINDEFQRTQNFPQDDQWTWSKLPLGSVSRDRTVLIERTPEEAARKPPSNLGIGNTERASATLLFSPLIAGGVVAGCLSVQSYTLNAYSPDDVELVEEVSHLIAPTLHSLTLRIELEQRNRVLAAAEARMRAMLNASHAAVALVDPQGRLLDGNDKYMHRLGGDRSSLIGSLIWDHLPVESLEEHRTRLQQVLDTGKAIRFVDKHDETWTDLSIAPVCDDKLDSEGAIIFAIDITHHHRALQALQDLEEEQRRLVEGLNVGIYQVSGEFDARIVQANTAFARILGLPSREDVIGTRSLNYYFSPEDRRPLYDALKKDGHVTNFRTRLRRSDGTAVVISLNGTAEFASDGSLLFYNGVAEDITARVAAEEELYRLATAVEQLGESVEITNVEGSIVYVNRAFERITGYSRSEALGKNPRFLKSGEQSAEFYRKLWKTILDGQVWAGRFVNRHKHGGRIIEDATIAPIFDESGAITHFVAVKKDITHMTDVEERLRQSQKMEAIGVLAGGIAHDFNNILQGILGFAELAKTETEPETSLAHYVSEIETAGLRASELVSQILAFSRKSEERRHAVSLQKVVKEALKLLRGTLPATIEIEQNLNPACGPVTASPVQIHQVIMNLGTNAYHAMRATGGKLSVLLEPCLVTIADTRHLAHLHPGPHVRLTVADTGCGIDPSILDRIFDPYFTTKQKEDGTGLGLATVHGIALAHGGDITVESKPGQGSRFTLYFPCAAKEERATPTPAHATTPFDGNPRIMVVEDEDAVLRLVRVRFEKLGARVEAWRDSREALEAFLRHPDEYDAIVTDQTMPRLTGIELMREVHRLRPDMGVVICSGFSEVIDAEGALAEGAVAFVSKPYKISDLADATRKALRPPTKP
ncbi:MAG: hypothetical protein PWP23_2475 [Candidatus Sumerlaeota bacterium]|nr:hypothetical protein [Candidatus Sumerlaeota bacterium]